MSGKDQAFRNRSRRAISAIGGWIFAGVLLFLPAWYFDPSLSIFLGWIYWLWLIVGVVWVGLFLRKPRWPTRLGMLVLGVAAWFPIVDFYAGMGRAAADAQMQRVLKDALARKTVDGWLRVSGPVSWDDFSDECDNPMLDGVDHGPGHDYFVACQDQSRFMIILYQERPGKWSARLSRLDS